MKVFEVVGESQTVEAIIRVLERGFKSSPLSSQWAEYRVQRDGYKIRLDIRDWGNWGVPDDHNQDEEDYDWKVPNNATIIAANKILDSVRAKYTGVNIRMGVGEKNWFEIEIG